MRLSFGRFFLLQRFTCKNTHNSPANTPWSQVDLQLHSYLKSSLFKEALLLFDKLRKELTPLPPPLLSPILILYLEKGPRTDALAHILSYLRSINRYPSIGLASLLISRAVLVNDSTSLKHTLELCFEDGVSICSASFTKVMQHLLSSHEYESASHFIRAYLDNGNNIEDQVLQLLCEEQMYSQSELLFQDIMHILTHYSERGKCIRNKQVFGRLADCLKLSNHFSNVKRTFLNASRCQECGHVLTQISISSEMYSSLEEEIREAIRRMYAKQKITKSLELKRLDKVISGILDYHSDNDKAPFVVVDCLSVATPFDDGWSELDSERLNCQTLLRLVKSIGTEFSPAEVVLVVRNTLLSRYNHLEEIQLLRESASIVGINRNSVHSLFALLTAYRLGSRALLLTGHTFGSLKVHFSPHLHTLCVSWLLKHAIRFDLTNIDAQVFKFNHTLWRPSFSPGGLHVPLYENQWICAKNKFN